MALVFCAGGFLFSSKLVVKHFHLGTTADWMDAWCGSGEDSSISCDEVLSSRWAWFPPAPDEGSVDRRRVSVASLGLAYFTFLGVWYLIVGRASRRRRLWHLIPLGLNSLGLAGSAAFVWVMATQLQAWCPLCLAAHACNALLFIPTVLLWPWRDRGGEALEPSVFPVTEVPPHPSARAALSAIALAVVLIGSQAQTVAMRGLQKANEQMTALLKQISDSADTLVSLYRAEPLREINLRPDDPARPDDPRLPKLVVWSDFECKHCREFAEKFEQTFQKHFEGNLQVVFKHYPLCSDCNPHVRKRIHPRACTAAALAEAVRLQGGHEAFWRLHDHWFQSPDAIKRLNVGETAAMLGLDAARLETDLKSQAVMDRIHEDIELGKSLGITGTPAVFLSGRQVGALARMSDVFWSKMGKSYRDQRAQRTTDVTRRSSGDVKPPSAPPNSDKR